MNNVCQIQQVGPSRFFCIAADCREYLISDYAVYCNRHWNDILDGFTVTRKNGLTEEAYRRIIEATRTAEKQKNFQTTQSATVTVSCKPGSHLPNCSCWNRAPELVQSQGMFLKSPLLSANRELKKLCAENEAFLEANERLMDENQKLKDMLEMTRGHCRHFEAEVERLRAGIRDLIAQCPTEKP